METTTDPTTTAAALENLRLLGTCLVVVFALAGSAFAYLRRSY